MNSAGHSIERCLPLPTVFTYIHIGRPLRNPRTQAALIRFRLNRGGLRQNRNSSGIRAIQIQSLMFLVLDSPTYYD